MCTYVVDIVPRRHTMGQGISTFKCTYSHINRSPSATDKGHMYVSNPWTFITRTYAYTQAHTHTLVPASCLFPGATDQGKCTFQSLPRCCKIEEVSVNTHTLCNYYHAYIRMHVHTTKLHVWIHEVGLCMWKHTHIHAHRCTYETTHSRILKPKISCSFFLCDKGDESEFLGSIDIWNSQNYLCLAVRSELEWRLYGMFLVSDVQMRVSVVCFFSACFEANSQTWTLGLLAQIQTGRVDLLVL